MSTPDSPDARPARAEVDPAGLATLGDRLADWLDGLGLTEHLAAAGLPTVQRNCSGAATWRDPATGEPLGTEQLLELDALLHQQGEVPAHAVPVPLLQIARRARVREELLAGEWLTYDTLAARRGTSPDAARFWAHKSAGRGELLVVPLDEGVVVPAFQLDADGAVRADLAPVLAALLLPGADAWRVWGWLTQPAALLGGAVPERAAADPDEAPLVLHAARRLAARTD